MKYATEPMPIPSWMLIDAVRYCLGRTTVQVEETTEWLLLHWDRLPEGAQQTIQRDVEEAFARDDRARAMGKTSGPLGMKVDRNAWEKVRGLWMHAEQLDF